MHNIGRLVCFCIILWAITLTPWGYSLGSKIFNNPVHNQLYCGIFSVLEKHPTTAPAIKYWNDYLNKCMIVDPKQEKKINDFLETNKEKLKKKVKTIEFRLEDESK